MLSRVWLWPYVTRCLTDLLVEVTTVTTLHTSRCLTDLAVEVTVTATLHTWPLPPLLGLSMVAVTKRLPRPESMLPVFQCSAINTRDSWLSSRLSLYRCRHTSPLLLLLMFSIRHCRAKILKFDEPSSFVLKNGVLKGFQKVSTQILEYYSRWSTTKA